MPVSPIRLWLIIAVCLCSLLAFMFFQQWSAYHQRTPDLPALASVPPEDSRAIRPIPAARGLDPARVALGERLFHDPLLSGDQTVSCASCHRLNSGGVDGLAKSVGVEGRVGVINAPTVFNSGLTVRQFWDGRAASLEEQINGPVNNELEMASNWDLVLNRLRAHAEYPQLFRLAYADGLNADNVRNAIATFERSLNTPDSPFDRYLKGELDAVDEQVLAGYRLFLSFGCVSCHQGQALGGNMYARFGIMEDALGLRKSDRQANFGRFNVTGMAEDKYVFKVPTLRNVALTAPYFHDGSVSSLEEAIRVMGINQLGLEISAEDQALIAAFLRSLTGRLRGKAL